jgi:hypothetical protein
MRIAIVENGVVTNCVEADAAWALANNGVQSDTAGIGDSFSNGVFTPAAQPALTVKQITDAVQAHLDAVAKIKNYDGILSCASYAASTNTTFAAEAAQAIAWRDAVWSYCYAQLAAVQAGTRTMPADSTSLIAELPAAPW